MTRRLWQRSRHPGSFCHLGAISATSCHFEQAFSADGGKTWEVNWIADDTRIAGAAGEAG